MAIGLALSCVACRPEASGAPNAERGSRLAFDVATMDGWRCRVSRDNSMSEDEIVATTSAEFTLVTGSEPSVLGLHLHRVEQSVGVGRTKTVELDESQVTITDDSGTRSQSAFDHPDVRRVIEAVTGAPRLWVQVDARGNWVRQSGRFDPVVTRMFPGLEDLGLVWMYGFPELPNELRAGHRWRGSRPVQSGPARGHTLDYQLERVDDEVATVSIHAEYEADLPSGMRGRMMVDGTAKIRTTDAAYLRSDIQVDMVLQTRDAAPQLGYRSVAQCEPTTATNR